MGGVGSDGWVVLGVIGCGEILGDGVMGIITLVKGPWGCWW